MIDQPSRYTTPAPNNPPVREATAELPPPEPFPSEAVGLLTAFAYIASLVVFTVTALSSWHEAYWEHWPEAWFYFAWCVAAAKLAAWVRDHE